MTDAPSATLRRVAHCLMLDALAAEVVRALREVGIEPVLLKGPATVRWLYPDDPAARLYSDVDLLVPPARIADAADVMRAHGFRREVPGRGVVDDDMVKSSSWVRDQAERIDLHQGFHHVEDPEAFWEVVRAHALPLRLADCDVLAPDRAGTALICALHACANGLDMEHSAKSLGDLERALSGLTASTWADAARRATTCGAAAAFESGLRMLPAGREIAAAVASREPPTPTVMLSLHTRRGSGDKTLARFLTGSSTTRIRMLRNVVAPSRAVLAAQPGAEGGLAAAYVRRMARIARQVPGAALRWRAAVQAAEQQGWTPARTWRPDRDQARAAWWALRAARSVRSQLRTVGPDEVVLAPIPLTDGPPARLEATVRRAADLARASCLASTVVRQRWLTQSGAGRDLVIGVTAPSTGFRAHAWLDGDPGTAGFTELHRHPAVRPRLPDFVVIGAPKAGSTSLYAYLRAHPQVFMCDPKEPEFFNDEANWRRGVDWYAGLFADAGDAVAVGEASVRYATTRPGSEHLAARMAQVLPDAKIVYVVRHPVRRMASQWQHNRVRFAERLSLADALRTPRYTDVSRYADRLEPYLAHYPAERIHVVVSERLRHDREAELRRLFAFLGLDPTASIVEIDREHNRTVDRREPRPVLQHAMRSRVVRAVVARLSRWTPARARAVVQLATRRPARPVDLDPRLVAELGPLFADDVARLRPLVDEPFDGWGIA